MTISRRLTVWYASILLAALALVSGSAYFEMSVEHPQVREALISAGHTPMEELLEILLYSALPAFLLAVVGGGFLMRRALSPISQLTRAIGRIHAENLHTQLPRTSNRDELDQLTEVFNTMTTRLDDSFQRVREFTLHASHELKTPLTIMRGELETALRDGPLSAPERQRISSLLEELQRLTQIVEGLNFLTSADSGLLQFEKKPVRFDELVQEACADARVLGEKQRLTVHLRNFTPAIVTGDRRRLRQLLLILTDNAIKYNHPEGKVDLALWADQDNVVLTITNTGPGIPPEMIDRVFDRFFRGDPSHNKEIDGCGLGLSIARRIVEAHSGDVRIESEVGQQTAVAVRLPAQRETSGSIAPSPITQAEEPVLIS
jgi:signal transduction histidine kinase